jgi:hypothetical protein
MTLAELKARIAAELHRSDLASQIAYAIGDAVAFYQSKRFRFNEARATFSTVAGTEFYGTTIIPTDIAQIDSVTVKVNGRQVQLPAWSFLLMEQIRTTTNSRSQPWTWSWWGDQIRLYPVPDAAYVVTLSYLQKIDQPAADGDSNAWTTDAAALIRHAAKRMVLSEFAEDVQGAGVAGAAENAEYKRLRREGQQLNTGGLAGSM